MGGHMDLTPSARAPKQAADADTAVGHSNSSRLRRRAVRAGLGLGVLGAVSLAWVAVSAPGHPVTLLEASASTGAPCGANELCIKQSQVPTTAKTFSGGGCGDLQSANPTEDLWHFVFPDGSFDTNTAHFTAIFGTTQIHAASIGGPNDKFAFVYSPAGATLTWAFATNFTGEADDFVLSGTCPASQGSSSSSSSTSTTTSESSSTTSHSSSSTSSSTTTTSSSSTTSSHTVTSTSSPTNGVLGNSTSSTSTDARGGVGGLITAPNTGAGEGPFALVAVMLILSGVAVVAVWGRRPSR